MTKSIADQNLVGLLNSVWLHASKRRHRQYFLLLIMMIVASFAEVFSIGAVIPFLMALTDPKHLFDNDISAPVLQWMGYKSSMELLLPLTLTFVILSMGAIFSRLLIHWASTKFAYGAGAEYSIKMYENTLYQPYEVHINRNSSEIVSSIIKRAATINMVILMSLNFLGSVIILAAIILILFFINTSIALISFVAFGIFYALIAVFVRKRLAINSQSVVREGNQVVKVLQEGLGGIRDVLIEGAQQVYCSKYRSADNIIRRAEADNAFIALCPRYTMEAVGILLIAWLAFTLTQQSGGVTYVIPSLGAIVLGAQRILPLLQQIYNAWANILGGKASLQAALILLDHKIPHKVNSIDSETIQFKNEIVLKKINFRYGAVSPQVLFDIDMTIAKGSHVGFIGLSGGGKSTLLDIIMGLLSPTSGSLSVDGVPISMAKVGEWHKHIAHVPQEIFLLDASIEENIAFGVTSGKIDHQRVRRAAEKALVHDFVELLPHGYKTLIGERGVRLSGGQRQRIGIARALYKEADLIIFDEATSALDSETESSVMKAIEGLNGEITTLTIAHRTSTLKMCDEIVELLEGKITRICKYEDIKSN